MRAMRFVTVSLWLMAKTALPGMSSSRVHLELTGHDAPVLFVTVMVVVVSVMSKSLGCVRSDCAHHELVPDGVEEITLVVVALFGAGTGRIGDCEGGRVRDGGRKSTRCDSSVLQRHFRSPWFLVK
jgi:hypothetical protein